jgi:Arc/MetJ-type ribon-helix-helix transcriptional regulator
MKRTTISLPDDVSAALEREAHRQRRSRSDIAREALRQHLRVEAGGRRELPFAAVGHSENARPAVDLEDELRETWADDIERDSFSDRDR